MEQSKSNISTPWHVWVVGVLLLLFNIPAVAGYVATLIRFEPYLSQYPEEALAYYFEAPFWMYAMWGISAFGGFMGAILLLMRNKLVIPVFGVGWICSAVAGIYSVVNPPPIESAGGMVTVIVLAVALLILIYAIWLKRRDVLR